jgi:hypothetical protein
MRSETRVCIEALGSIALLGHFNSGQLDAFLRLDTCVAIVRAFAQN